MSDAYDVLKEAHQELRRGVRAARRAFARSPQHHLAEALQQGVDEFLEARANGVSFEDGCKGLEEIFRQFFKTTKFETSCAACEDTGWRQMTCHAQHRCGRGPDQPMTFTGRGEPIMYGTHCAKAHPDFEHVYVVPCECPKGDAHRAKRATTEDAIVAATRGTKRKGGFTRFGR